MKSENLAKSAITGGRGSEVRVSGSGRVKTNNKTGSEKAVQNGHNYYSRGQKTPNLTKILGSFWTSGWVWQGQK